MSKFRKNFNIIFSGAGGAIDERINGKSFSNELHKYNSLSNKIDFGILYNALTHPWDGEKFKNRIEYDDIILMADSGGYQLSIGKIKGGSEEVKCEVYNQQATNANYGFCFDEVPVYNGYYDHTQALGKTLQTNANIKKQIEIFKTLNTKCKIFPIAKVQPEDREISYENLLKDCDISLIAGMGANTEIFGDLFAYPFFFKEFQEKLKFPNVLHHLGIGALTIILPFYLLALEGFFGKDFIYSVDTTYYTHSLFLRSSICGINGKFIKMSDLTDNEWEEWRNYCLTNIPEFCVDNKAFYNLNRHKTMSVKGGLNGLFVISATSYAMKMFVKMVEDPWKFAADNNILTYQQLQSIKELAKCRDWKDYYAWKGVFGSIWSRANPRKVNPLERSNLNNFFV